MITLVPLRGYGEALTVKCCPGWAGARPRAVATRGPLSTVVQRGPVCRLCVPPSTAASASKAVRDMLFSAPDPGARGGLGAGWAITQSAATALVSSTPGLRGLTLCAACSSLRPSGVPHV